MELTCPYRRAKEKSMVSPPQEAAAEAEEFLISTTPKYFT